MPEQVLHKGLTPERWNQFPMKQRFQMIESEFFRAAALLKGTSDRGSAKNCYLRAKELINWVLEDLTSRHRVDSATVFFDSVVKAIDQEDFENRELLVLVSQSEDFARLFSEVPSE